MNFTHEVKESHAYLSPIGALVWMFGWAFLIIKVVPLLALL